jgi:integrase
MLLVSFPIGMANHHGSTSEWANRHRSELTTRHTHEDVLSDREFELLLEACTELPESRVFEARFICLAGGRLGLRGGEIAHFHSDWIDWDRKIVRICQHQQCACGYCDR